MRTGVFMSEVTIRWAQIAMGVGIYFLCSLIVFFIITVVNGILFRKQSGFNSSNLGGTYGGAPIVILSIAFPITMAVGFVVLVGLLIKCIGDFFDDTASGILRNIGDKICFYDRSAHHRTCETCNTFIELSDAKVGDKDIVDVLRSNGWQEEGKYAFCKDHSSKEITFSKLGCREDCHSCFKDIHYDDGDYPGVIFHNDRGFVLILCNECLEYYIHNLKTIKYDCLG